MAQSRIEWTDATWNPTTGCTKISAGCTHCYAAVMARRLQAMGQEKYERGFTLSVHESVLGLPFRWKKPRAVFVNSMGDLFHQSVSDEFVARAFDVMAHCPRHRFQLLTKRAARLARLSGVLPWPSNIWMGVSVEDARQMHRIDLLRSTHASLKFLSLEPLLGPLPGLDLDEIGWVIVGGESGPKARPMDPAWALDIRDRCVAARVPFFFKQWGGTNKKRAGRLLNGRVYDEMPKWTDAA
jgi:protein gp37